ncbi:MAG: hypothetical protein Q8S02_12360 [Hydrogenophaga sp.]|nr:hypothetical protein [Hydrogenophaga sp.]
MYPTPSDSQPGNPLPSAPARGFTPGVSRPASQPAQTAADYGNEGRRTPMQPVAPAASINGAQVTPATVQPAAMPPTAPPAPDTPQARGFTQVGTDAFRQGNGYTDRAGVMGTGIQMGAPAPAAGQPAMGANQQALARLQAGNAQPAGFTPAAQQLATPSIKTSANDWETRNNLRNLRVSANSLTNDGKWGGRGGMAPDVAAYLGAVETDNAARQGKNPLAQELLQQQGGIVRTGMQEAGATDRTAMTEGGNMARAQMTNDTQAGELALKQEAQGFSSQAARRLAAAQDAYVNEADPAKRTELARTLAVLSGKTPEQTAAPSGFRWTPQGNLQAITGGPADRSRDPKLTEDQGKAAGYAVRMENSLNLLNEINQTNPGATRPGVGTALLNTLPEGVANLARTEDRQRVEAAQLDALDAALTLNTGAAYTREQLQGMSRSYFAQPGDSDQTAKEKQNRLASLIETARLRAGPQGNQMADAALERGRNGAQQPAQPAGQPQPAQVPQAGEVRKGYRFKGGDPADRNAWEAAQ